MQDSLFVSRRLQDICLIAAQQSREATMNKNLLNSLNRTGYKGSNVDDAMREMLGHTTSSPLLTHADVRRRAIVENYVHQTDERINENLMAREFTLQVQARETAILFLPYNACLSSMVMSVTWSLSHKNHRRLSSSGRIKKNKLYRGRAQ